MPSTATPAGSHDHTTGELVPGLQLVRRLARGGFAEVWEAEQTSLGRRVAVKIMRNELLGMPEMVRLFEQESRVLARLNHPNVVQVIDRGTCERGPYFVMEFVEGETLQSLLSKNKLSRERALSILLQAARGLAYAHLNRVVHRDVKPANILVGRTGQVKIGDFGIAAVRAVTGDEEEETTAQTTALGTRAFMAPEQRVSFDRVEPRADVFSLGVILHRIVTGKLPDGPGKIAEGCEIAAPVKEILEKSLAESSDGRYPNAGVFREALVNTLEGRHLDDTVRRGIAKTIGGSGRFELLDVIRHDRWRSVYLVRKGGEGGDRIVVKRYLKDRKALRTVRQLMRIEHPNIIRVFAVGERDDSFIILMEHLSGGDLRERLVQPHAWRETARIGRDVALALAVAHKNGVVHANLRPSNILFDEEGRIRVADFGLPEHYRDDPTNRNWYAAPEPEPTPARDLYALGAILFEMLHAMPATESNRQGVIERTDGEIPQRFAGLLERLMAPEAQRSAAAEHVARELTDLMEQDAEKRRAERLANQAAVDAEALSNALRQPPARTSYGPAVLGLAGLILAWLMQSQWFRELLVELIGSR